MELGTVVVDKADIIDDDVIDLPIIVDDVHFVTDDQIFGAICDNLRINLCAIRVVPFTREENR